MIAEEEEYSDQFLKTNFKIVKSIGKGCQGQVFEILHTPSNKHFALKTMFIHPLISEKEKRRIQCQIQSNIDISSHLSTINFPKMHHYWVQADSIDILFELCQQNGEEGFKKLKRYYQRYNYLLVMIFDILSALSLLQRLNIIHRDIKSQNILLKESIFKLADLGLSRPYQNGNSFTNDIGNRLGRSPEFITGNYSFKADIWSLGIHVFYMLENTLPFDEQSLRKIKTDPNKIENVISSAQLQINLECSSRKSKNALSYIHMILSQMIVIDPQYRASSTSLLLNYFDRDIKLESSNVPRIALFGYLHERPAFSEYYLIVLLSYLDFYRLEGKIKPEDVNKRKINFKVQLTLLQLLRFTRVRFIKDQQKEGKMMELYDYVKNLWQAQLLKEFPQSEVYYDIEGIEETLQIFKINRIKQKFVLIEWVMKLVKSVEHIKRGMQCCRIPIWQIPLQISKIM